MAIYTTFFVMSTAVMVSSFPGWKPPLPQPATRMVTDFFGTRTIQTRIPLFERAAGASIVTPTANVVNGSYASYLETRLPDAVRKSPHWAAKSLTSVELDALGKVVDGQPAMQEVLFGPPPDNSVIYEFRTELLRALVASPRDAARKWAAEMSRPEDTHTQAGVRIAQDWSTDDALEIIQQLIALMPRGPDGTKLYLLVE
jgi:hypothetical protein